MNSMPMLKIVKHIVVTGILLWVTGCSLSAPTTHETTTLANHPVTAVQGSHACKKALGSDGGNAGPQFLDSSEIDLLVWNIHKNKHENALTDLAEMAGDMDLVLLQEARLSNTDLATLEQASFRSFAPGFRSRGNLTGVMTISSIEPMTNCNLQIQEPWIRTPKAVGITEFALTDSEQTLAVVNIHGINFTLGSKDFARQLNEILTVIKTHDGPVIVAGDFNTWNKGRVARLDQMAQQLDLHELTFPVDHRVKPFSYTIDKILVRGLTVQTATTRIVESSDHNPLTVRLSL